MPRSPRAADLALTLASCDAPLRHRVADAVVAAVAERRLRPGDDLPSTRVLAERLGISRKPSLMEAEAIASPMLTGILRPAIVVPTALTHSCTFAEQRLILAHELTHVVQQRSGPVDGEDTGTGVKVSDPHDRFEQAAEANADRIMSGGSSEAAPASAAGVQREVGEDEMEETAQGMWVQREDIAEEEVPEEA